MKTRSVAALAAVVLLILVAGVALLYAARPQVLDAVVYTPPSPSPTVATATAAATASGVQSPVFAASECTNATATTRQVIERYFALSTSNSAQAVTDCFAKAWRDKSANFAESAALWSHSGPATNVVITFGDAVNGCDRFRVTAQMPSDSFWMRGQTGGQGFFSVGVESVNSTQPYGGPPTWAYADLRSLDCAGQRQQHHAALRLSARSRLHG